MSRTKINRTKIAWTDFTWNPATGCKPASEACKFCYARLTAENKRGTQAFPVGFDLKLYPERLKGPARRKKRARIFVCSMSDLFLEEIPDGFRDRVFDSIEAAPQHTFQLLTKRADRMLEYSRRRPFPPNVWAGVTVESNRHVERVDVLRQVGAAVRFVSAEPLLDPLPNLDLTGIDWLIVGGESGTHLWKPEVRASRSLANPNGGRRWVPRDDRVDWVRSLRDRCVSAGTTFFFKQWGGAYTSAAGHLLDGREWRGFPA